MMTVKALRYTVAISIGLVLLLSFACAYQWVLLARIQAQVQHNQPKHDHHDDDDDDHDQYHVSTPPERPQLRSMTFKDAAVELPQRVQLDSNTGVAPVSYRLIGYLVSTTNDAVPRVDGGRLPLYGQASLTRKARWNYYTMMDGGLKVPVTHQSRDCMDEVGCDELSDGDTVSIADEEGGWRVKLYSSWRAALP
jgi:hypothetical protein